VSQTPDKAVSEAPRKWWLDPTDADLGAVHHALRMLAKHPMVSRSEAAQYTELADAIWALHFTDEERKHRRRDNAR
jgi:hypothetical protein